MTTDPTRPEPTSARRRRARRQGGVLAVLREVLVVGVTALFISFLIKTFLLQAFWIPSGSMEDTLVIGDRVVVSKIQAGPLSVDRGDIVVFEDPGGWLPPLEPTDRGAVVNTVRDALVFIGLAPQGEGNHLIKRVIGLPGDHVVCCDEDQRLTVNGEPLAEDYLYPGDTASMDNFDVVVPDGRLWVMGDHRSNSSDSRFHDDGTGTVGSVPVEDVTGQAVALVWPVNRWDALTVPDAFADVPAPQESAP